jgi:cell wall assembly regulator SMI1
MWMGLSSNALIVTCNSTAAGEILVKRPGDPMTENISTVWDRLDAFLAANAPNVHRSLQEPLSATELRALEQELTHSLPSDVRGSLARHNGQAEPYMSEVLFDNEYLLSATDILRTWRLRNEVQDDCGGPREGFWVPRMIPVTETDSDGYCVDATTGAVWYFLHDQGLTVAPVAPSWVALLSDVASAFERGAYNTQSGGLFLRPAIEMDFG